MVRCRSCREEWFATVDAPAETEAPAEPEAGRPVEPAPEPILGLEDASGLVAIDAQDMVDEAPAPRRAPPVRPMAGRFHRLAASGAAKSRVKIALRVRPSAVVVAVGVAVLGVLVGARVEIVRAAPSLASLYELVRMPVNVRGLAIRDIRSVEEMVDGAPLLLVTGIVENVSNVALDVPRLRLAVTAQDEREIYAWTTVAGRPKLEPGETAAFRARLASPPAEGQAIAVRFLARRDLMASLGR